MASFTFAAGQNCAKQLKRDEDKFTGKITYYTPLLKPASIMKVIENGAATYYLILKAPGSTYNVGEKGVYILFENKEKMMWEDEEVDPKISSRLYGSDYDYSSFIKLNEEELNKLISNRITDFKLYIYEKEMGEGDGKKFQCLVEAIKAAN